MEWDKVTVTTAGNALLSGMLNGARLTFTRAELGDTAVKDELLPELTSVFSPIAASALIAGQSELEGHKGTQVKLQIRNEGVTKPVRMRQVGIYAMTDHSDEVLFGILQSEVGEEIPAFEDFSQFEIQLYATFILGRTNNIKVIVSPCVYMTQSEFDEFKATLETKLNSVELSSNPVPAVGVRTHFYITKSVPGYVPYDPEAATIKDGMLETDSGVVRGFVQDESGESPMILKLE